MIEVVGAKHVLWFSLYVYAASRLMSRIEGSWMV